MALITILLCNWFSSVAIHSHLFIQGCTFILIFGLPGDKHEDDPARALNAGHRILDSLHQIMEITWVVDKIVRYRLLYYIFSALFPRNRFQMEPISYYLCTRVEKSLKQRERAKFLTLIHQRTDAGQFWCEQTLKPCLKGKCLAIKWLFGDQAFSRLDTLFDCVW